jgi:MFS family permease
LSRPIIRVAPTSDRLEVGAPGRVFHGWRIVAVLAFTETISWGVLYYAYAVFQVPLAADLGLSAAQTGGAFALGVLLTGIAAIPVGRWLDRRGPRGLMTLGAAISSLLVLALSQVQTAWGLYVVMAGIGLARATVLYDPAFAVLVRWFSRRRSTALLAVTIVAGFASTIALPTSNALIEGLGWRSALMVLAVVLAATTVLPHWLVVRRDPADLGLHPDGAPGPPEDVARHDVAPRAPWHHLVGRLVRDPVFRWYAIGFAAQSSAVIVVAVNLVPLLREAGHSNAFAAAAAGGLGALSVSGRLVLTSAARRVTTAGAAALMFALQSAGVVVLLLRPTSTAAALTFVVLFGLGFGVGTIARPALTASLVGPAHFAGAAGLVTVVITLATTAGPLAAGVVRAATGSWTPVLTGVLVLAVTAAGCLARGDRLHRTGPPATG